MRIKSVERESVSSNLLTTEIAKRFLESPCDLQRYSEIEVAAAEVLVRYPLRALCLDGLVSLSDDVARVFNGFRGSLSFGGLSRVTDSVAKILGNHAIGELHLDGLRTLSEPAAGGLGKHRQHLSLNGCVRLAPRTARSLGHLKALSLNGLSDISDETLEGLCINKHKHRKRTERLVGIFGRERRGPAS